MKLIGAEIRVGYDHGPALQEAKLIPLEVVIPPIEGQYYFNAVAEVTFHTGFGDVTVRAMLPSGPRAGGDEGDLVRVKNPDDGVKFIRRQLEKT